MKAIFKEIIYFILSPFIKRRGDTNYIYITFDDGPHPSNTPKLIDILFKHNVRCTFFMQGKEMEKHPDIVKDVINRGHTIGYHSYYHISLKQLSFSETLGELNYLKKLSKKFNYKIKSYRPPYGDLTVTLIVWAIFNRVKIIMWSKDSRDSFDMKDEVISNVSSNNITGGEILLFHDDYRNTTDILDEILKEYSENNIKCSTF